MRWKLLLIASLSATVAGAGLTLLILYALESAGPKIGLGGLASALIALLFPLAAITYASIFVYRRTARRRSLQAMLTALLSIFLTLAVLLAAPLFLGRNVPRVLPPRPPRNIG
jgi:hypothetical protein